MTTNQPDIQNADLNTVEKVRDTSDPMPIAGAEVRTADEQSLGKVAEIRANYFKIDAAMAPDYWLPVSNVSSTIDGVVYLTFAKGALDDYKVDRPEAA
jgi:hypothetical protein